MKMNFILPKLVGLQFPRSISTNEQAIWKVRKTMLNQLQFLQAIFLRIFVKLHGAYQWL